MAITFIGESVRVRNCTTEPNFDLNFPLPGVAISLTFAQDLPVGSRVVLVIPFEHAVGGGHGVPNPFVDSAGNVYTPPAPSTSGVLNTFLADFGLLIRECVLTHAIGAGVTTLPLGDDVYGCSALAFSRPSGPSLPFFDGTYRILTDAESEAGAAGPVDSGSPTREVVLIGGALASQNGPQHLAGVPEPEIASFSAGWVAGTAITINRETIHDGFHQIYRAFRPAYRIVPAGDYDISAAFSDFGLSLYGSGGWVMGLFWTPVGFGSIRLRVLDPCTGLPAWGIRIVRTPDGTTQYADSNGEVLFDGLGAGAYGWTIGPDFDSPDHLPQGVVGAVSGATTLTDGQDFESLNIQIGRPEGCPGGSGPGIECAETAGVGSGIECAETGGAGTWTGGDW